MQEGVQEVQNDLGSGVVASVEMQLCSGEVASVEMNCSGLGEVDYQAVVVAEADPGYYPA